MIEVITVGAQFGLAGLCIGYFVWRDARREKTDKEERQETVRRIQKTEDWIRENLMDALQQNTAAFKEFAALLRDMLRSLKGEDHGSVAD